MDKIINDYVKYMERIISNQDNGCSYKDIYSTLITWLRSDWQADRITTEVYIELQDMIDFVIDNYING